MTTEVIDPEIYKEAFAAIGRTFRGQIWENCQRFKLVGKAYEAMPREQNGHFQIKSAHHLKGPLKALLDPNVRVVITIGATQVMKSVAGDIWVPYLMEHCPRNLLVLFETDPKALLYCDTRFMDTIKQHPVLSKFLAEVDRHDVNKTFIKMPGMTMLVGGLNDGNASSLSWPYIWISEAWQHGKDGLLRKAIKRADRFPNDCKILIESQAGLEEEDLHTEAKGAHQVPLTWACPFCGGRQTWEFSQLRPSDFKPLPRFDGTGTPPKPETYAGMTFAGETREVDGKSVNLSIDERARTAYWECYHCGSTIKDTRTNRQTIMDSYEQDYQITGLDGLKTSPRAVVFYLPKESARDNTFEDSAKAYLTAKDAEKMGNMLRLQDWYLQERAVFYSPRLAQKRARVLTGSHDIDGIVPNEVARMMMVDCQQDPDLSAVSGKSIIGHFWYVAWAIDKDSKNIYQLARGYAKSWLEWIKIRKALKIPNKNVCIDGGNWLHEVVEMAAVNWEPGTNYDDQGKPFKARVTWSVMRGSGTRSSWMHENQGKKVSQVYSPLVRYQHKITIDNRPLMMNVPVYEWSNLTVKNQLFAIRQGGEGKPKLHVLSREKLDQQTQEKEKASCTYESQISNEYKGKVRGKDSWIEINPNVHYNDCECMGLVKCFQGGLIGHVESVPEEVQTA